jgi:hypothetical protein
MNTLVKVLFPTNKYTYVHAILDGILIATILLFVSTLL